MVNLENLAVSVVIIALIKALKEYVPQVKGVVTVIVAGLLGAGAGYLGLEGLTVWSGLVTGLSAVGIVTVVGAVKK